MEQSSPGTRAGVGARGDVASYNPLDLGGDWQGIGSVWAAVWELVWASWAPSSGQRGVRPPALTGQLETAVGSQLVARKLPRHAAGR